ncbi:MAG: 50S ribosomal protein L6 [Cenarchaeum sp. SB0665_bin_23]|nr:50S ribosomal protein L6 [Cenarchaeum sp. SB0667_bin_13]MXY61212.1 50S ribosomal protein L6 [Cenarchaeum sp. SB0665_bin_23]MXZ93923.1 50S ribosomal protein L6 [Cenarchaeum sp. SB0666_bin_15]MYB46878.1 50S ribosomal protein L6 [Cenarchaeum sp. SB0662_bin_33]MYC80006.1 50S ribosomal protein L6 [Cenarchaeum sp. SB0661_bin_35]MYD59378.1 50S ribosomal protein L6 [Cenarchaeum sp. SB0678_bin_8]MYG33605.1 50S ribosomal protein L6 [Cenarchaeum sp. SB0677_bin_16]MYI51431.1 50S ribosomal protein L6 
MPIKPEKLNTTVQIPTDVSVTLNRHMLVVDGPRGRAIKNFRKIPVGISIQDDKVLLKAAGSRKRDFAILNTSRSLIRNLCEGVVSGYTIKMKVVFAHFPITINVKGNKVHIENFQGERAPRIADIVGPTKVESQGDDVVVTGHILTDVTQTAANIQLKTRIKNKDRRVFLDGIYRYDIQKIIK